MENNCLVLKIKDSVQGDYNKLNCLKIKVYDGEIIAVSPDKVTDLTIKAEGCTFSQSYLNIIDSTEHIFKNVQPYIYLSFTIKGNGYLYISNKYNLGYYKLHNVDLDKIYSYDKAIKYFSIIVNSQSQVSNGNINHLLSQCSSDLKELKLVDNTQGKLTNITGDFTEINRFVNLIELDINIKTLSIDIINFSSLINLSKFSVYDTECIGNVEELAQAWYNNGKTTGTVYFYFANTNIIVPSEITNKGQFYCTFTTDGYTFSQTNPNA